MSGAEASFVLGLVSSLITIIETTKKVYDAAKDAKGQPEAFRQVAARLPLILNILENTRKRVPTLDEDAQDALESTLESCKSKAEELKKIFEKVVRKNDDKWIDRYKRAVKATLGKQARVEGLMEGILKDIQVLACEKLTGTASPAEIEEIKEAMKEMEDMPSSLPEDTAAGLHQHNEKGDNFGVTGGSTLNVHTGKGDQHNNKIAGDAHFNINSFDWNQKCIQDLRTTDPRDDKKRIEATKDGLLKDAYRWVLDNPAFQEWREGSQHQLLWINGDPGKGKTMLLCGIINELEDSMHKNALITYFFCQATDSRINNATAVLRGLLHMLVSQQPSLVKHVLDKYNYADKAIFKDVNAWYALTEVFEKILQDPSLDTTYLLIDALDECVTGLQDLLDFIAEQSSASSTIKWIVSSRNWPQIEKSLRRAKLNVRLSLELNAVSVSEAVEIFIKQRVTELAERNEYDERTKSKICDHLSSKADNTFLWVALACQQLKDTAQRHVEVKLKDMPFGLNDMYKRMMRQIDKTDDSELCKQVLRVVALVYRPVALKELVALVKPLGDIREAERREIIENCGSFLRLQEQTVYFVHQSAKDFLLDKGAQKIFSNRREPTHYTIFARSLQNMSRILRRDMYGLKALGTLIEDVNTPDPDPLAALHYSCVHWVDHLCDLKPTTSATYAVCLLDKGAVDEFLSEKYLYWLESLSLLKSMSKGIASIRKLEILAQERRKTTPFTQLVHDAYRFIMYHRQAIEKSPLQTYASALLFSPNQSLVRRLFQHEEPKGIIIKPGIGDRWSACLQTFERQKYPVTSVSFSHDSTRLASASKDSTIKVWDTNGACLQTFKGHTFEVTSVSFSHDSARLVSASKDWTIKVWDTSGACLQTLKGHDKCINSVSFSCDSTRVVSTSKDRTIKIWDASSSDACPQTLVSHRDYVNSAVFSHDSTRVASASEDKTIKIWNSSSGECLQTLVGHSGYVNSVVFSHDSTRIASASEDRTIKIWDASSSQCLQTLVGHSDCVTSVVFSHDSTQLASASADKTIKIWDAISGGASFQTLQNHSDEVYALTFSPDSTRLASMSKDMTIKVWDTSNNGTCLHTLTGHDYQNNLVVFSPDLTRLASVSNGNNVKIWDISNSGACLLQLSGHIGPIKRMVFSPDSKWLASTSLHVTMIWDTSSKVRGPQMMSHDTACIYFSVFSHDSKWLVSVNRLNTIRIWDAGSGRCIQTIEGKSMSKIYFLVFSHGLTSLAAISGDKTIRIWNTSNGECVQTFISDEPLVRLRLDDNISIPSIEIDFINVRATMGSDMDDFAMPPYPEVDLGPHVFSSDGDWILFKDKKMVWLPPDFRPLRWNICQNVVGIATGSGRVWSYRVDIEKASQLDL